MTYSISSRIAFLGMGLMGSRMARRLLDAGASVSVWNRTPAACEPLLAQGASPLDWARLSEHDVILLCLADDIAVEHVAEQIRAYCRAGQVIVDFSSLSVALTQRLAADFAELGIHWIDAPVSGGVQGAAEGTLVIFAGGDAAVITALQPIFAPLSQRVTRMGACGSGQATKICNQLIVAASSTLIAEAVALAQAAGVDARLLPAALAGGFADSKPFQILAPRMALQQFEPLQWKVATLQKDLGNALQLANTCNVPLSVAPSAYQQLANHAARGYREQDLSTLIVAVTDPAPSPDGDA